MEVRPKDIVFLILAHNEPELLKRIINRLLTQGGRVIVHVDKNAGKEFFEDIRESFNHVEGRFHACSEVRGEWGKWSLVAAELLMLKKIQDMGWDPAYVHLMSGSDYPIKSTESFGKFLSTNCDLDYIEAVDISKERWVQGGLEAERFQYHFPFSYRVASKKFSIFYNLQKSLGMTRKIPFKMRPFMGSQWWTLRWNTCVKILDFINENPKIVRYFRTTLIPDESFFQTLVAYLIPSAEIANFQLLFHILCPHTRPFLFRNGHETIVSELPHFFIRKVEPSADTLLDFIDSSMERSLVPSLEMVSTGTCKYREILTEPFKFKKSTAWRDASKGFVENFESNVILLIHDVEVDFDIYSQNFEYLADTKYLGEIENLFPKPNDGKDSSGINTSFSPAEMVEFEIQRISNLIHSNRSVKNLVFSCSLDFFIEKRSYFLNNQSQVINILIAENDGPKLRSLKSKSKLARLFAEVSGSFECYSTKELMSIIS